MPPPPRILIVTAAFGEGHNSAARNMGLALAAAGAITQVSDPCMLGTPRLTAMVNAAYRYVTTNFPQIWAKIYYSTDRCDLSQQNSLPLRVQAALAKLIQEFRPDAVVSTYPLYPYSMTRIQEASGEKIPVFIVVTDSIEINAAWLARPLRALAGDRSVHPGCHGRKGHSRRKNRRYRLPRESGIFRS